MIKMDELRKKNQVELQQVLDDLAKERFSLRIKRGSGLNPKPHLFRENKISMTVLWIYLVIFAAMFARGLILFLSR